jgi:TolA-binding protein
MQNGPSKEELEEYWNNSRQYFDELASYYRTSDRDYYNKYIAPFYSPFRVSPSKGGGTKIIAIAAALIVFLGIGAAMLLVLIPAGSDNSTENNDNKQQVSPKISSDSVKSPVVPNDTSSKVVTVSPYYDKGMKYYHSKDYENAKKYFEMVPREDKNYRNARKQLLEIKIIRGEE